MISIVDYGMGNIRSVRNALDFIGVKNKVIDSPSKVLASEKLILPGVGYFSEAMKNIQAKGLLSPLNEAVLVRKVPVLGICLGMHLLLKESEEGGATKGFGWIDGKVKRIPEAPLLKVPHIGFNTVYFQRPSLGLFENLGEHSDFYFAHSYRVLCDDVQTVSGWVDYGDRFAVSIEKNNIFGTQFHPEKSQSNGLAVLKNFCKLRKN
ncbi:MAG: imidazole glycerol phosphate synthase subunit HisH [Candidatus Omnitrophica bacterium]|nr:imidazole glycerol phosphate synthase subunit HisH [Candidatus Omnitrophota bacterium]